MIWNGLRDRGNSSASARSTPTWYAERAPPPVSTSPTVGRRSGLIAVSPKPSIGEYTPPAIMKPPAPEPV